MKSKASLVTGFFSLALGCEVGEAGEKVGFNGGARGFEGPRCHLLVDPQ